MPYDKYNRWIPPNDGYDAETGYNWMDHDLNDDDFLDLIDSGEWESIGISNLNDLSNLYQTPEWSKLTNDQRVQAIGEFQDRYWDEDHNLAWDNDDRASEEWGLDIRRTSDNDGGMADSWEGAYAWFTEMSGEMHPSASKIDWASYNDDNLYDAARKSMVENHSDIFGDNYMNKYDTIKEVRTAQGIINNWSDAEREEALEWASKNITPNKKDDDDIQEYFPTRKFDPASNTTTYYNHLTGQPTGESKTWLPPAPPQSLKIVKGDAPTPTFNNEGVRIANEADITGWYKQYLNRTPDAEGLAHWMGQVANGMSFENIQHNIMKSEEANALGNKDFGRTYYNPQEYGSPESITAKMVDAPPKIQAPSITIRNIGEPKKPTKHYMALNDTVWTDPSVDTRSTRWDAAKGKQVSTGKPRKNAEFMTEAPIKGGT